MGNNIKNIEWAIFIMVIEILYVITELSFNSAILNATGGLVWSRDSINTLEFYGRILSGFGFGLMILKLNRFKPKELKSRFFLFLVVISIAIPSMYFAQKIIIDEGFIKVADNELLEKANESMILKRSFQLNTFQLGHITFEEDQLTNPNSMALTAMLGLLVINDENSHTALKNNSNKIFTYNSKYFNNVSSETVWNSYNNANLKINDAWNKYQLATKDFNAKRNTELSETLIKHRWDELIIESDIAWREFKKARGNYIRAVGEKARSQLATIKFKKAFNKIKRCKNTSCRNKVAKSIRKGIKKNTGFDKPISFWYKSNKVYEIEHNYLYYKLAQAQAESGDFKELVGFDFPIDTLSQFMKEPTYTKELVKIISTKYGITNFKGFNGTYNSFSDAYQKAVIFTMAKTWYKNSGEAFGLPPNLTSKEFYNSNIVQNNLKSVFGLTPSDNYVVKPNMSKEKFTKELNNTILNEKSRTLTKKLLNGLTPTLDETEKSKELKKENYRDSLRSIVVPPIALFFSLFFSAFILVRFPLHILSIYFYDKSAKWKIFARSVIITTSLSVIFVLPFIISHNNTENQLKIDSTISYFDNGDINMKIWELPLRWFFATEPIIYPIGNSILGYIGINNINHPKYKDDFDSRYIDDSEINLAVNVHSSTFNVISKSHIREAQKLLNKTGYNVGVADGVAGAVTIKKAQEFANDIGFFSSQDGVNPYGVSGKPYMKEGFNSNLLTLILMARQ